MANTAVLVVGAGPVGLLLACELARREVAIRVVDKLPRPTSESRAIVVHARSLEMLERVGVAHEVISTGIKMTGAELHTEERTAARIALDTVDSPFPFSVALAQTETERILTARLRALGVEIERGVELTGFDQDDHAVRARLRHSDGRHEQLDCAFVTGSDGSHSTVRSAVGTKLEGTFKGERFLLADVEASYDLDRGTIHSFFTSAEGPLFVFPMRGERLRVIAQLTGESAPAGEPTLAEAQEIVDRRAGGISLTEAHWLTVFEIHHAQVPQYRHGRAFLAGDAAHVHSPAGGQGMNTGMQDAFNLGWKLALAVKAAAAPGLLDSYHSERHPVAARVIEQTTRMTAVGTLSHKSQRVLRNHLIHFAAGLAPLRRKLADQTEETEISYRDSPIVAQGRQGHGGPRPGDAAPDVPGLAGGRSLHELLAEDSGHTLLEIGAPSSEPAAQSLRRVTVTPDIDPEGLVARRYGVDQAGRHFVIRPDGYIGLSAAVRRAGPARRLPCCDLRPALAPCVRPRSW